jgi:hypothetical protein
MNVFVLQHVHTFGEDDEDVKMIGVYSSRETAELAIKRLSFQPGFRKRPQGFCIDQYTIDQDCWVEGYITYPSSWRDGDPEPDE